MIIHYAHIIYILKINYIYFIFNKIMDQTEIFQEDKSNSIISILHNFLYIKSFLLLAMELNEDCTETENNQFGPKQCNIYF